MTKKQFEKAIDEHNAWVKWVILQEIKKNNEYNATKPFWKPQTQVHVGLATVFLEGARRDKSPENYILWKKGFLKLMKIPD